MVGRHAACPAAHAAAGAAAGDACRLSGRAARPLRLGGGAAAKLGRCRWRYRDGREDCGHRAGSDPAGRHRRLAWGQLKRCGLACIFVARSGAGAAGGGGRQAAALSHPAAAPCRRCGAGQRRALRAGGAARGAGREYRCRSHRTDASRPGAGAVCRAAAGRPLCRAAADGDRLPQRRLSNRRLCAAQPALCLRRNTAKTVRRPCRQGTAAGRRLDRACRSVGDRLACRAGGGGGGGAARAGCRAAGLRGAGVRPACPSLPALSRPDCLRRCGRRRRAGHAAAALSGL